MDILKQLNDAAEYIEQHLCDDLDLNDLAGITLCSPDSFSRFFSYFTGMTLKEYMRKRRLTLAAYELRNTDAKVIDIALKYGYNSSVSFSRAFRSQHGINPSDAGKSDVSLKIYPPVSFQIIIKGAEKMDFRIIETNEIKLKGLSKQFGTTAENRFEQEHFMWSEEYDYIPEKICSGYNGIWYGIWNNGTYSIARKEEDTEKDNLETIIIPKGKYAVFVTEKGGYAGEELPNLHNLIFENWMKDSGYSQKGDLEIEVYHLWTDRAERRAKRYYEIWIPIE